HAPDLRRVVVPPREVVRIALLAVQADEALQRSDARVERSVQRMRRRRTVDRRDQRLSEPALPRQWVAVRPLLDLDVLPRETLVRDDVQPRLIPQVGERQLWLRVDRIDFARPDRLDLGVRVRDEAE